MIFHCWVVFTYVIVIQCHITTILIIYIWYRKYFNITFRFSSFFVHLCILFWISVSLSRSFFSLGSTAFRNVLKIVLELQTFSVYWQFLYWALIHERLIVIQCQIYCCCCFFLETFWRFDSKLLWLLLLLIWTLMLA